MHGESSDFISGTLNRRRFLKIGGAGLTGVALLGVVGPTGVLAQERGSSIKAEFKEAAREYKVPMPLLMAMGYVNTGLEMPPPDASDYERKSLSGKGLYGIMALVKNPSSNTLGEASELTGIPEEELKTDRAANIMGGAALLASSQGDGKPPTLGDWLGAVAGGEGRGKSYRTIAGVGGGKVYADQVSSTLKNGASASVGGRERVDLPPQSLGAPALEGVR